VEFKTGYHKFPENVKRNVELKRNNCQYRKKQQQKQSGNQNVNCKQFLQDLKDSGAVGKNLPDTFS